METRQPTWELIANLGDVNPLDYGGYFVYRDTTGVYPEEAEKLFCPDESAGDGFIVYRFPLDRLKIVAGYLVPLRYDASWPNPLAQYDEWFNEDLYRVAKYVDMSVQELRDAFCSEDAKIRARAYEAIGDYHGYENLDSYPLSFTNRTEVEARYAKKNTITA